MLVRELVNRRVPIAHPADDVRAAARTLVACRCGVLPVVEEDAHGARVVGLLGYRDAFVATYGQDASGAIPVGAAMSTPECTCRESDSLGLAVRLLRRTGREAIPVLDADGYLVGVLSFADLVRDAAG